MEITKLQAEPRQAAGTRAARRLRKEGKLPAIIYGHGTEPENVAVGAREFGDAMEHGGHLLELDVKGSSRQVLIKGVQFDHLADTPNHVDFILVDLNERVTVSVQLEFRGTPVGMLEGGTLEHDLVDIEVSCLVTEIPDSIRVNVAEMKVGDVLHVSDLELSENLTAITALETSVCTVRAKTVAEEVEVVEGEEAAEGPEIIGRKEKEPGDEA